jgi:hypothetical protein
MMSIDMTKGLFANLGNASKIHHAMRTKRVVSSSSEAVRMMEFWITGDYKDIYR